MVIAITGTNGSGKGEKCWEHFARGCQIFFELAIKNADNYTASVRRPYPYVIAVRNDSL